MERLDKIISNQMGYSRKEVKDLVKSKRVLINDVVASKSDIKVDVSKDIIKVDGKEISVKEFVYLMLNKPKGYVSATEDKVMPTVLELIPIEYSHRDLFPAGRLDRDTTGLMLITDDGEFAHNILSPKKHVKKTYEVVIDIPMTEEMVIGFKNGVNLIDGECKSSELIITGEYSGTVILTEGRYHQIKRMFGCFGAKVLELNRVGMGNFYLPADLEIGECREFTDEDLKKIKGD
ncbi:MAG: rRNA pseudouridine synthase [Bacilli bacterium]|nr:rRNA pseudouridine synthase [Bacilli bacterium]